MSQSTPNAPRTGSGGAVAGSVAAVLAVVGVVAYLSVAGGSDPSPDPSAVGRQPAAQEPAQQEPAQQEPVEQEPPAVEAVVVAGCSYQPDEEPPPEPVTPPTEADVVRGPRTAVVTTDRGIVTIALDGAAAPCAVASFTGLARQDWFDDTPCHRLTTEGIFVLQCGDPTGSGAAGPGYAFEDEALEGATYPAGTLAMANAGPGTNGSQFFLVHADTELPPSYTPFGTITGGLDVVQAVAAAGAEPAGDGAPVQPVQITDVTVS